MQLLMDYEVIFIKLKAESLRPSDIREADTVMCVKTPKHRNTKVITRHQP